MTQVHHYVGWSIPIGFALLVLWTIYSMIRNRPPHDFFWTLLGILQAVIGIQVLIGSILFASGLRPHPNGPVWLHYVYGGLFPAAILVGAHRVAKKYEDIPWLVFGIAAFVCFGLTFRALQTGLGVD